ncbi:hypothetical protein BDR04DRAFT_1155513 [Suillus decipiens]|nr:hypothetical protein BDR04DRAFT_1155513 [Suillus decipiens]
MMCDIESEVEMKDYQELSDQEDDHTGNQDADTAAFEVEEVQQQAHSPLQPHVMVPNEAMCNGHEDAILAVDTFPEAGQVLQIDDAAHVTYTQTSSDCQAKDNPYYPCLSECDYEIAQWAIQQRPSQNAFSNFLSIDQVKHKLDLSYKNAHVLHQKINHELPGVTPWCCSVIRISGINEEFELFIQDPVKCVKELWANPAYLNHLTYALEHRFTDEGKIVCIYDKLMSGDWSWEAQVYGFKCFFGNVLIVLQTLLPDGTTLVPVILSSDKTQLCQF